MFMFGMTGMAHDATVEYNGRRRSEARTAKVSNNRQQNKSAPTQKQERGEKKKTRDDDDDDDDPDSKDASSLRRRRRLVVDAARRARKTTDDSKKLHHHRTWFRALFHFDEAHPTVPGDGQARVVAKPRDVHAGVFARLQNRHAFVHVHFSPVHEHRNFLFFFF